MIKTRGVRGIIQLVDPWRFNPEQKVYVRGWQQEYPVTIVERMDPCEKLLPHYICQDHTGDFWILSQIELSTRPLLECK